MPLELVKLAIIIASIVAIVAFCALIMIEQIAGNLYKAWKTKKHYKWLVKTTQSDKTASSIVHVKKGTKFEVFIGGKRKP